MVLDLVGPYTRYGRPVIDACVASGAHYADLTGELPFVRGIIDDYHERAAQAGLKLVQVCGFEALPADLLVAELAELAGGDPADGLRSVDLEVEMTAPPGRPARLRHGLGRHLPEHGHAHRRGERAAGAGPGGADSRRGGGRQRARAQPDRARPPSGAATAR